MNKQIGEDQSFFLAAVFFAALAVHLHSCRCYDVSACLGPSTERTLIKKLAAELLYECR